MKYARVLLLKKIYVMSVIKQGWHACLSFEYNSIYYVFSISKCWYMGFVWICIYQWSTIFFNSYWWFWPMYITFLMRSKSEVLHGLDGFFGMIQTQCSPSLKALRTDNVVEFLNFGFQSLLRQLGILNKETCIYTS